MIASDQHSTQTQIALTSDDDVTSACGDHFYVFHPISSHPQCTSTRWCVTHTKSHLACNGGLSPLHHPSLKVPSRTLLLSEEAPALTFQLTMKRSSDQVKREERPEPKRQRTTPG